ncbi:hypothetical protein KKE06_04220 [Candidatus Micrarchaeota archaeon]|nr:hypothetical protein [Candidatus Micrarchaeota archaeon]
MPTTKKKPSKIVAKARTTSAPKEKSFSREGIPMYIGILLLVLGIILGFGFHALFFPPEIIVQPPAVPLGPEPIALDLTIVIHPDCKLCSNESSLELLLTEREKKANVTLVDATTPEGADLVQSLGIDSFPTTIVNTVEFKDADAALFATLQTKFSIVNNSLVLPEKDLMLQTKIPAGYMLKEIPGGVACELPENKVLVWEFGDLLGNATYNSLPSVSALLALNRDTNEIEYDFKYLYSSNSDSESVAIADACSKSFGVFETYHRGILERWHSLQLPTWNWVEQLAVAEKVGLEDLTGFQSCVEDQDPLETVAFQTGQDTLLAQTLDLQQVPSFVVDCQFVMVNHLKLVEGVCQQHPELSACESA